MAKVDLAQQAKRRHAAGRGASLILALPVLSLALALMIVYLVVAGTSLPTRWPITYPEGAHVAAILRLRAGDALYPEFLRYPYVITPYPPLLYLLGAVTSGLAGLGAYESAVLARGLTLITSVGTALTVVSLARSEGAGRLAALTAGALLLPIPLFDHWGFAVRPDLPAIFLSLLAALAIVRKPDRPWLAGTLAGLAILTKLTAVALPAAALLWLIATRRPGTAIQFGIAAAIIVVGGGGLTQALSGGHALAHTVLAHMNPLLPMEHALAVFSQLPRLAWFPCALALLGCMHQLATRRVGLSGVYWLVSLAIGLYTLRGRGGDVNYLLEPAAATCWLAATGLHVVWRRLDQLDLRQLAGAVLVLVASLFWGSQTYDFWRRDGGVRTDRRLPIDEIAAAESVLAEEPTMVLLAGKPLVVSDPFHLSMLQTAGRYDPAELVQRIRRREYALIVLRGDARQTRYINGQPKWPESVRRAIAETYIVSKRVDLYWLYVPDPPRQRQRAP